MYGADAVRPKPVPALIPTPISRFEFSTNRLEKADQFSAWRDSFAPLVDLHPPENPSSGYLAKQTTWDLDRMALTRLAMPGSTFERTPRQLRSYSIDHWCFLCVRSGTHATLTQQGACATSSGAIKVVSLQGVFHGSISDLDALVVFIPRDLCGDVAGKLDAADNTNLTGGLGYLLSDYLIDLEKRLPMISESEAPNIVAATRAMILACLAPTADSLSEAQASIDTTLLERARRMIRCNLTSATFGSNELCRSLGVSRSRLYRLFEPLGGVVSYIRTQRLLDAHIALSNSEDRRTIVEIAAARGFADPAEFSRAFKREFGYRPKDARGLVFGRQSRRDIAARGSQERPQFGELLRQLQ
jgi:AraC-like DNA-binding protein